MARSHPLALLLIAATAAPLTAQLVNPLSAVGTESGSRFGTPFTNSGSASVILQEIHGLSVHPTLTGNIAQVAWRRDNDTVVSSGNYVAFSVDFALRLSTSPRTTQSISQDFASNRGVDYTLVHNGVVSFPAQAKTPNVAGPFVYAVPFATPFPYAAANGDLLVEVITNGPVSNPNSLFFCDASSQGGGSSSMRIGTACGAGSSNDSAVYSNWAPGGLARILQYNGPSSVTSALMLGTTGRSFAGLPLPLDLGFIGAPGCALQHDLQLGAFSAMTSGSGRLDFRFEIPAIPGIGGLQVRAQFANLGDTLAGNSANLSLTQGHEVTLATPTPGLPAVSEAHATFSGGPPNTAALVQQGYGKVCEFTVR